MTRYYYVYVITNKYNTVFYIGVTGNLEKRIFEHREELVDGFSKQYKLKKLVYYEVFELPDEAIAREKQLKNWHRDWKINLIKGMNPKLEDLWKNL